MRCPVFYLPFNKSLNDLVAYIHHSLSRSEFGCTVFRSQGIVKYVMENFTTN